MINEYIYLDKYICFERVTLQNEAEYAQCRHWNEPYVNNAHTLLFFDQGTWNVRIEGAEKNVHETDLCILRCLEACIVTPLTYPCVMFRISFSSYYFKVIDPGFALNIPFNERHLGVGNFYRLAEVDNQRFYLNLSRVEQKTELSEKRLALYVLLIDLLHEICHRFDVNVSDTRPPQAREVLDYINAHYCEDIGINDLTQRLYMSRSQIERIMKTSTGYSTWNYILEKRVTRASQLLHSGMSNREVAEATGFRDYSTFYKAYVKISHRTPTGEHPSIENDPHLKNFYSIE